MTGRDTKSSSHAPAPASWGTAARLVWLAIAVAPAVGAAQDRVSPPAPPPAETARLVVRRPTVVAYLVVPPGAVDTSPDLAVVADDWNYSMATLGDSLQARGIRLVLVTEPALRVGSRGAAAVTLSLGEGVGAGYVFVRPGAPPCVRRGGAEIESVLAAADAFFTRGPSRRRRSRDPCGPGREVPGESREPLHLEARARG